MTDVASGTHLPSPHYKRVILCGAKEHRLPQAYIAKLEAIQDNGFVGACSMHFSVINELNAEDAEESSQELASLNNGNIITQK